MELADRERVLFHGHPSWRATIALHVKGVLAAIALGVTVGVASAAASGHVQAGLVIAAVVAVFVAVFGGALLARRRVTYTITNRRLAIEIGLMAREVHETRLEQIQNVNARQSPIQRLLGVGSVVFDTAGGAAFEFSFAGVADPRRIVRAVDRALHDRALSRV